jgi:hypothetical protein
MEETLSENPSFVSRTERDTRIITGCSCNLAVQQDPWIRVLSAVAETTIY